MSETPDSPTSNKWPDYQAIWRWHFYAGIFTMPFIVVLSISGAIYLFKPQIEAWNDRAYDNLTLNGAPVSAAVQVQAALAAFPGSTTASYELPGRMNDAARVIVRHHGKSIRVYLHPVSSQILHFAPEDERFMRTVFKLHGELLIGERGSNIVELAASWTIIMILTGLYLWWPRQSSGLGGILYPRLRKGSRIFWRDIHSVTGVWISSLALFLLLTGLPWAKFWGGYFKKVRNLTGTAVVKQSWSTGSDSPSAGQKKGSGGHGGHGSDKKNSGVMPSDFAAFDRIAATVQPMGLEPPVVISPPTSVSSDEWAVKSTTQNRPKRASFVVEGKTGRIISSEYFKDLHWVDRTVSTGVAAHEGQLFGWPNQLLGLLTALGLLLLSVSGAIMWWKRRDEGVLGAPSMALSPRISWGLITVIVLLGIYLPLFGASLLLVFLAERFVLSRIPKIRTWLGLQPRGHIARS